MRPSVRVHLGFGMHLYDLPNLVLPARSESVPQVPFSAVKPCGLGLSAGGVWP